MRTRLLLVLLALLPACSSRQLYRAAEPWRENFCETVNHPHERERCMDEATLSYEEYRRRYPAGARAAADED